MAQPEMLSIANVAKASVVGYNDKNWDRLRSVLTSDCVYDEVASNRRTTGIDNTLSLWRGWADAMPDSKATFDHEFVKDNTVVLELTWRGTHSGVLRTPAGEFPPTGKRIQIRACQVIEVSGEKTKNIRHYFDMNSLLQQLGLSSATTSR
jgi:steroid delta-isomerase-like uncharacterized protein